MLGLCLIKDMYDEAIFDTVLCYGLSFILNFELSTYSFPSSICYKQN